MPVTDVPSCAGELDHVALWVTDPVGLARQICEACGHHVIEQTDAFTLIGPHAKAGKLTLFAAEGPREQGALERIEVLAPDLRSEGTRVPLEGGAEIELVPAVGGLPGDLAGVVLTVADVEAAHDRLIELGFAPHGRDAVHAGGRSVVLRPGVEQRETERPVLNHLALLVPSTDEQLASARAVGAEIVRTKDAANTYAGFVAGPGGIEIEYVEHKPGFALV